MQERRKSQRVRKLDTVEIRLSFEDAAGVRQVINARIIETGQEGMGVEASATIAPGTVVAVRSQVGMPTQARVQWCVPQGAGRHRLGLYFESVNHQRVAPSVKPAEEDHYEVLQVNPRADIDTIHRVYRLMAQRFHPDNKETGSEEHFKRLLAAYRVLSDPESRAAYDAQYKAAEHHRWQLFETPEASQGVEAEKRKRSGVVAILYRKRVQQAGAPSLSIFELENLLGVAREQLEFTLWYLKENGLITRTDNNRFLITVKGVDYAEEHAGQYLSSDRRLLTAPSQQRA